MKPLTKGQSIASWILQIMVALIFLQTLFFKFKGAEESIYIFTELGVEPWGRYASGIAELIASVLILIPATVTIGALLALGVISGAILSHLAVLGIVVQDDAGTLFAMACVIFLASAIVLFIRRQSLPVVGKKL